MGERERAAEGEGSLRPARGRSRARGGTLKSPALLLPHRRGERNTRGDEEEEEDVQQAGW